MMPSQMAIFRGSAQCFYGIIALTLVTFVAFQLKADNTTVAFIYLAVIVLLSLIAATLHRWFSPSYCCCRHQAPRAGAKTRSRDSRKLIYNGSRTH